MFGIPDGKKITIDISVMALFKVLAIILAVVFVFYIRNVVLILFVSLVLASAFDPSIDWLQKHKIPRSAGILLIYLVVLLVLSGAIYLIIPPIAIEVNQLSKDFPMYWEKITSSAKAVQDYSTSHGWDGNIQDSLNAMQTNLSSAAGSVFSTVFSLFGGLVSFFVILFITFYLTVEEQAMKRVIRSFLPVKYQPYITHLINRIQEKIGHWLRGQLLLSLIIFIVSWIGLSAMGVKYALVLALFAGVTEIIPYLGPFLGAIPAVFIGFTMSPWIGLGVIILYGVIQLAENHIIVPKVMQKVVGLNPVVTIVAILIGAKIAGVLGLLLAVPVATALSVFFEDVVEMKKQA
ncbi:MAG: AI-2E family transporter [Patescibacteria group bacterium]